MIQAANLHDRYVYFFLDKQMHIWFEHRVLTSAKGFTRVALQDGVKNIHSTQIWKCLEQR